MMIIGTADLLNDEGGGEDDNDDDDDDSLLRDSSTVRKKKVQFSLNKDKYISILQIINSDVQPPINYYKPYHYIESLNLIA